jgi:biotin carboxyl carrier protein
MARLAGTGSSYRIRIGDKERLVTVIGASPEGIDLEIEGSRYCVQIEPVRAISQRLEVGSEQDDGARARLSNGSSGSRSSAEGSSSAAHSTTLSNGSTGPQASQPPSGIAGSGVIAPMPGVVVSLPVQVGTRVEGGTIVAVIEAMKMENSIISARAGVVREIHVSIGKEVERGQTLVSLDSIE